MNDLEDNGAQRMGWEALNVLNFVDVFLTYRLSFNTLWLQTFCGVIHSPTMINRNTSRQSVLMFSDATFLVGKPLLMVRYAIVVGVGLFMHNQCSGLKCNVFPPMDKPFDVSL